MLSPDRSGIRLKPDSEVRISPVSFMNHLIGRSCWRAKQEMRRKKTPARIVHIGVWECRAFGNKRMQSPSPDSMRGSASQAAVADGIAPVRVAGGAADGADLGGVEASGGEAAEVNATASVYFFGLRSMVNPNSFFSSETLLSPIKSVSGALKSK